MKEIVAALISGSLLTALFSLFTMRSRIRKAEAESRAADLANTEIATKILMNNIVEPLKKELNEMRMELQSTKKELVLLRKAIDYANNCPHFTDCPVLFQLQKCKILSKSKQP